MLKKIAHALAAAVTSPEAVKQERSFVAFVIGRVLLACGAGYGVEQLVTKIISG